MRIILRKGLQRNLIIKLKKEHTWKELSKKLILHPDYIRNELKNEKRTLSEETYKKICQILNNNFDNVIIKKLGDNWGKSKGGLNSTGNTKILRFVKESKYLAELIGIILGDGHLEVYKKGKKRNYSLKIAGDKVKDYEYLSNYVSNLINRLFKEKGKIREVNKNNEIFLSIHGKKLTDFLQDKGLKPGNKKTNNQEIPKWIKDNNSYLKVCLRGLIDTDGSVHYISKLNKNPRISFTSCIPKLMKDVYNSFRKLNIHTSKVIREKQIFISSKESIKKYLKEIGFSNPKHLKKLQTLNNLDAPVV